MFNSCNYRLFKFNIEAGFEGGAEKLPIIIRLTAKKYGGYKWEKE